MPRESYNLVSATILVTTCARLHAVGLKDVAEAVMGTSVGIKVGKGRARSEELTLCVYLAVRINWADIRLI